MHMHMSALNVTDIWQKSQVTYTSRSWCDCTIKALVLHVAHTYANPIVVSVSSASGRAYTMLRQTEWCYSGSGIINYVC